MESRTEEEIRERAENLAVKVMNALTDAGAVSLNNISNWNAVSERVVEQMVQLQKDALL